MVKQLIVLNMCSIVKCSLNGSPLFSNKPSPTEESPSARFCSYTSVEKAHDIDDANSPIAEDEEVADDASFDAMRLQPEDVPSQIFCLCFAVEMTFLIKQFLSEDCQGCCMSVVIDGGHTCDLKSWKDAVARYYKKAESYVDAYKLRLRLRTFKMKPEIYGNYQIPNDNKFNELMMRCRYFWIDYIYDMILKGFPNNCDYAVKHAFQFNSYLFKF